MVQQKRKRGGGGREPKSLRTYLDRIRDDPAEFRTVSRTVNPMNFDVTGLLGVLNQRREYPTVQFNKPLDMRGKPSPFPIVTNLWGTRERCAEMVGLKRSEAGVQLGTLLCERIESTPAIVVNWRSSTVATDDAIVAGSAPERFACTWMVGISTSGMSLTGRLR